MPIYLAPVGWLTRMVEYGHGTQMGVLFELGIAAAAVALFVLVVMLLWRSKEIR